MYQSSSTTVVDTFYYDILGVTPRSSNAEIKAAYKKLSDIYHPDKNPNDPTARKKLQELSVACSVLIDQHPREEYNKYGRHSGNAVGQINVLRLMFAGDAFADWVGETSELKGHVEALCKWEGSAEHSKGATPEPADASMKKEESGIIHEKELQPLARGASFVSMASASTTTPSEKTAEADLKSINEEMDCTVKILAPKLISRLDAWTETDQSPDRTAAFAQKTRQEVESLKEEEYGVETLHVIGEVYTRKATSKLGKSKYLGFGRAIYGVRDLNDGAKYFDTWAEDKGKLEALMKKIFKEDVARRKATGTEDCSEEVMREYWPRVDKELLLSVWATRRFQMQQVLSLVCKEVLDDKTVPPAKRMERAAVLKLVGEALLEA